MRKTIAVFMALFICGCNTDVRLPNYRYTEPPEDREPEYETETLSGTYEVHIYEAENTCRTIVDGEDRLNAWDWMNVLDQRQEDIDGHAVNIGVVGLGWLDVAVAANGEFEDTEEFEESANHIVGILTPDEVTAIITLSAINAESGEIACSVVLEIDGYLLFERAGDAEMAGSGETEEAGYKTISGLYETDVVNTMSSCEAGFRPWRMLIWVPVMVQERFEDGSCIVNLSLNMGMRMMLTIGSLPVAADGTVDAPGVIAGTLTPDELALTINVYVLTPEFTCLMVFETNGIPIFDRAIPPERFEDR